MALCGRWMLVENKVIVLWKGEEHDETSVDKMLYTEDKRTRSIRLEVILGRGNKQNQI